AEEHAREGKRDVMLGLGFGAPFVPLHSADAFGAYEVGPGARHGGGFLVAVKIDEHFALGGFTADLVVVINHHLIAALHEVDLDAFDAPLFELVESGLKLVVQGLPNDPHDEADVFLFGVGGEFVHVEIGDDFHQIAEFVPAFVENDVGNAVFGGEVDVVFVGGGVNASFEIYAVDVPGVPPIPGNLAGLDPRSVLQLGRFLQQPDDLVGE